MQEPVGGNWCMTGVVTEPARGVRTTRPQNVVVLKQRPQHTRPRNRQAREVYTPRADKNPIERTLGVILIIAALALVIGVGQIANSSYQSGLAAGIAQGKQTVTTQAYDKGVADGYEQAQQEAQRG